MDADVLQRLDEVKRLQVQRRFPEAADEARTRAAVYEADGRPGVAAIFYNQSAYSFEQMARRNDLPAPDRERHRQDALTDCGMAAHLFEETGQWRLAEAAYRSLSRLG